RASALSRIASSPFLRVLRRAPPPPVPYTLSLHDALPILTTGIPNFLAFSRHRIFTSRLSHSSTSKSSLPLSSRNVSTLPSSTPRSEEHTSELQSRENLVCRLLLEKKNYYQAVAQSLRRPP